MKGETSWTEEFGGTTILIIFVIAVIIISLLFSFETRISGADPLFYTIEFVNLQAKPFLFSHSLSFHQSGDRQFLEHALESAVTGSVERASSQDMPAELKMFAEYYDLRMYFIDIRSGDSVIMSVDNVLRKCGDGGVCISKFHQDVGECGIGREKIDDNGACGILQKCCKEMDIVEGTAITSDIKLVRCGPERIGVCSKNLGPPSAATVQACSEGRFYYLDKNNDRCTGSNGGKTPICCIPKTPGNLVTSGASASAEIPLFFREAVQSDEGVGMVEVTIG